MLKKLVVMEVRMFINIWSGLGFFKFMLVEIIKELRRVNYVFYKFIMVIIYEGLLMFFLWFNSCEYLGSGSEFDNWRDWNGIGFGSYSEFVVFIGSFKCK